MVLNLLRYFPDEIETDLLSHHGVDIHDWWNRTRTESGYLKLSSRRVMVLLNGLPESAKFKNAYREDWDEDKLLLASLVNDIRILRSEQAVYHNREYREPMLVKSPAQLLSDQISAEHKHDVRAGIMAQLHAPIPITE